MLKKGWFDLGLSTASSVDTYLYLCFSSNRILKLFPFLHGFFFMMGFFASQKWQGDTLAQCGSFKMLLKNSWSPCKHHRNPL